MSIALLLRVEALEKRLAELEAALERLKPPPAARRAVNSKAKR